MREQHSTLLQHVSANGVEDFRRLLGGDRWLRKGSIMAVLRVNSVHGFTVYEHCLKIASVLVAIRHGISCPRAVERIHFLPELAVCQERQY